MKRTGRKYRCTLEGYLRWRSDECKIFRPVIASAETPSAAEAMNDWESRGLPLVSACAEPELLADYVQGKRSRDWHVTEWRSGIADGLFHWTEFIGTFGLTEAECRKVLGIPDSRI